jgi:hypothetical protein
VPGALSATWRRNPMIAPDAADTGGYEREDGRRVPRVGPGDHPVGPVRTSGEMIGWNLDATVPS